MGYHAGAWEPEKYLDERWRMEQKNIKLIS